MILKEDYCSFEVAKLLKEKGFDWMCNGYYNKDDEDSEPYFGDGEGADNWNNQAPSVRDLWFSAPTYQMAMKWLREKGYHIVIMKDVPKYQVYIQDLNDGGFNVSGITRTFNTYEEAVETALKYTLTKLI